MLDVELYLFFPEDDADHDLVDVLADRLAGRLVLVLYDPGVQAQGGLELVRQVRQVAGRFSGLH